MNCELINDMHSVKEMVVLRAREAYLALKIAQENTEYEEELMLNALMKVLEEDRNDKEQFVEYLALSYMLQGIATNLRLGCGDLDEDTANLSF